MYLRSAISTSLKNYGSWWSQLDEFINIATDSPRLSTIDARHRAADNPGLGDEEALIRKRRALGVQVGVIILSMWFYYVGVFIFIYWPWLWLGQQLFGPGGSGSHAMAGAPILGGLLGLFAYSILAGVLICLFKARRRVP